MKAGQPGSERMVQPTGNVGQLTILQSNHQGPLVTLQQDSPWCKIDCGPTPVDWCKWSVGFSKVCTESDLLLGTFCEVLLLSEQKLVVGLLE